VLLGRSSWRAWGWCAPLLPSLLSPAATQAATADAACAAAATACFWLTAHLVRLPRRHTPTHVRASRDRLPCCCSPQGVGALPRGHLWVSTAACRLRPAVPPPPPIAPLAASARGHRQCSAATHTRACALCGRPCCYCCRSARRRPAYKFVPNPTHVLLVSQCGASAAAADGQQGVRVDRACEVGACWR
jgi:hypothetical protein